MSRTDEVLAALRGELGEPTGEPVALGGGLTNENLRVPFACGDVVVRLAGHGTDLLGIDRADEAQATRNAAALGLGPEVVAESPEERWLVTRYVPAAPLSAEDVRGPWLPEVARALRTLHDGPPLHARFDVREVLAGYARAARTHGVPEHVHEPLALHVAAQAAALLTGDEHEPVPCHNDLLAANLLDGGDRLWIVDWEYAGTNDRYFDLANLAVNNRFGPPEEEGLLSRYFGEADSRRLARLRLMRLVADAREAAWGLVQQGVSQLDFDYAGYADLHFARLAEAASGGRLEQLLSASR
jgi:thiamine kinase-like enzyme